MCYYLKEKKVKVYERSSTSLINRRLNIKFSLSIYPSIATYVVPMYWLLQMNNAAMSMRVHISFWVLFLFLSDKSPKEELLHNVVVLSCLF